MSVHNSRIFSPCTPCGMVESVYIKFTDQLDNSEIKFCNKIQQKKFEKADKILSKYPNLLTSKEISKKITRKIIDLNDMSQIEYLSKKGFIIDFSDLYYSLKGGNSIFRAPKLMSFKAILHYQNLDLTQPLNQCNYTLFHQVAETDNSYACEALIEKCREKKCLDVAINKLWNKKRAPLHVAFEKNNSVFKILVKAEETDLTISLDEKTLCWRTAETNDIERFSILFSEHVKRKNIKSALKVTGKSIPILFILCEKQHNFILRSLFDSELDLTIKHPNTQKTLLHFFAEKENETNFDCFIEKIDRKLLASIIDEKDSSGETALSLAVRKNNYSIVEKLIKLGANFQNPINGKELIDIAPRFCGCHTQSRQIIWNAMCGKYGAKHADALEENNNNPLIICLKKGEVEQAKKLIHDSISLNITDDEGNGPLLTVIKSELTEEVKLDLIRLLRRKGDNVNRENASKESLLIIASIKEYVSIVEEMTTLKTDSKKNINLELGDLNGNTALHHAVKTGNRKIVKKLIDRGAKTDAKNKQGQSPIFFAKEDKEIVHLLIVACADVEAKDISKRSPMDYIAITERSDQVGKVVYSSQSDIKISEKAAISGNMEIAKIAKAHEEKGTIESKDLTPDYERKSDSIGGFMKDIAQQGIDQAETLSKKTLNEVGNALDEIKTEGINTLKEAATGAIKTVALPLKVVNLVDTATSVIIDKATEVLLK